MTPSVSIITPTYNHRQYISDCIESVLRQTYDDYEMIVVDDGSDDGTADVVREFSDDRITLLPQENRGIWKLAETYNRALKESEGKYVAILEGDDKWPADKLEVQISHMEENQVVMSCGEWLRINPEGNAPKLPRLYFAHLSIFSNIEIMEGVEVIDEFLSDGNSVQPVTVMIRRDALTSIGGFRQPDYAPYVDYPTFLELFKHGDLLRIPHVLGFHRHHSHQVTQRRIEQITSAANRYAVEFYDALDNEMQSRLDTSREELLENREGTPDQRVGAGRIHLLSGEWEDARREFRAGLHEGNQYFKTICLVGLVHSYVNSDMEWLAKMTNKRWFARIGDESHHGTEERTNTQVDN